MRRTQFLFGILSVLLLTSMVVAQAQAPFTGTWVLDRAQSQLPAHRGRGAAAPDSQVQPPEVKLTVAQQGSTLKATRTMVRGNQERSLAETYVADGSEQLQATPRGSVTTRAAFEGNRFLVSKTFTKKSEQGESTMSRESVWTLSPDGKVLTIDTTFHGPRGDRNMRSVYQRS
jgi:hypothetical protein